MSNLTTIVHTCLLAASEYPHDDTWHMVYIDNARPVGMPVTQYRACLSALSKQGFYKPYDNYAWGLVRKPFGEE